MGELSRLKSLGSSPLACEGAVRYIRTDLKVAAVGRTREDTDSSEEVRLEYSQRQSRNHYHSMGYGITLCQYMVKLT